jgi:Sodium/hydrogen exchanger family
MGDRFDEVHERARHEALARELKFGVTDANGWQTVYGYDNGASRARFERSVAELRANLRAARRTLDEPRELALLDELNAEFDRFLNLDRIAYRELRNGRTEQVKRVLPRPRAGHLRGDRGDGRTPRPLRGAPRQGHPARLRRRPGRRAQAPDSRGPRGGPGDRAAAGHRVGRGPPGARGGQAPRAPASATVTEDLLLTLSLLLVAALVARLLASLIRVPEILVLVAMGALFGPFALDVIDVPIESTGAQLLFTLGVSMILFHGGLNLSVAVLRRVWVALGLLVGPGSW